MSRLTILEECVRTQACGCQHPGECYEMLKDIVQRNGIDHIFQKEIIEALRSGRKKMRNICVLGKTNMGKSFSRSIEDHNPFASRYWGTTRRTAIDSTLSCSRQRSSRSRSIHCLHIRRMFPASASTWFPSSIAMARRPVQLARRVDESVATALMGFGQMT